MRLWSLHPCLLDRRGLVALWREALLAQAVLRGETRGYRHHPQLARFAASAQPAHAIAAYLTAVQAEASRRGYRFDAKRIGAAEPVATLPVTQGQLDYEWRHLRTKLRLRDPAWLQTLDISAGLIAHPLFHIVAGGVEDWERV